MRTPDDIYDELLVLRCQEGDADALVELVERWRPRLFRYALRLTGGAGDAEEVAQATWLAILRSLNRLQDPACFRRWAYQIAARRCVDWVRQRQRDRADAGPLITDPVDEKASPQGAEEESIRLREALRQLPPDHRLVLSMFYLDDAPLTEIADTLGLPIGTVKSRLHYARQKLKILLEGEDA